MPIGVPELLIVLVIVLLILGPKRLPRLGKQLGGGIREFKDSITKRYDRDEDADADEDTVARPAITAAAESSSAVAPERDREGETTAPPGGGASS